MSIDWNWGIFLQQAPFGNTTYLGWIWSGFQVTIALSICAWIIAFLVGSFFGILRTVPNRFLSGLGTLYVETVPQRAVDCAILYLVSGDPGAAAGENRHVV
ncbi:glutamate/aspartate transport system permease [Escherichia coli]|nr:glutamate/aspartate transport system permease [Escherichia coli]